MQKQYLLINHIHKEKRHNAHLSWFPTKVKLEIQKISETKKTNNLITVKPFYYTNYNLQHISNIIN